MIVVEVVGAAKSMESNALVKEVVVAVWCLGWMGRLWCLRMWQGRISVCNGGGCDIC